MSQKLKYLVIHCSATPEGREYTSDDIRKMHCSPPPSGRGWKQVGYSDMIHLDGKIENLVPYNGDDIVQPREITNGAIGLNGVSRHVMYVGGVDKNMKPKDTRTTEQWVSLQDYVLTTIKCYPEIIVLGHNQVASKACPSFHVPTWLKSIGVNDKNIFKK